MNHVKVEANGQIIYVLGNPSTPKPFDVAFTNFAGIHLT